jgi:hypothetical protein
MSYNDMKKVTSHPANLPSDRSFGLLFIIVFCVLGSYALYKNWHQFAALTFFVISVVLIPISFFLPGILRPFNEAWFWLGQTLGKIINPIVLGIIFFLLLTPIALIGKALGRDELKLKKRKVHSYWVERSPVGPTPESFKNQF